MFEFDFKEVLESCSGMYENPKVAVLLAAYNGAEWLDAQVSSILNQESISVTLFVSIDASDDGTEEWFTRHAKEDERIRVLSINNSGAASQNFFRLIRDVDVGDFSYVCLSDQDDIWQPTKICRAVEQLEQHEADGYSSNILSFWSNGRTKLVVKSQRQNTKDYLLEAPGPGCTFVIKQSLFLGLQRFAMSNKQQLSKIRFHDWFIYAYSRAFGYQWRIDDAALMNYRQHETNEHGANVGFKHKVKRARAVFGGYWFEQVLLTSSLLANKDPAAMHLKQLIQKGRWGFFQLALESHRYRRSRKEQLLLCMSCIGLAIVGFKNSDG